MARKLRNLTVRHVALVDKGANPEAHILLYKQDEPMHKMDMDAPMTTAQVLDYEEAHEDWYALHTAFMTSLRSIMEHAEVGARPALMTQAMEEFVAAARPLMARMGKGNDAENEMIKRLHPMAAAGDGEGMVALLKSLTHEEDPMPSITGLEEKLHQAEAKNAELAAEVAKLRAPEAEPEDVLKSLPEAIRKRIEDAEAKAAEAEAVAKRERDARQEREYIEKMQAYTGLPVNPAEDWRVLKALDALPAEYAAAKDRLLALLKAGDEAMIHANITKRQGHSGSSDMGTSAYGRIESQARELVSKGFSPTMEQAMDVVIQQFPSLYAEYRREQKGA